MKWIALVTGLVFGFCLTASRLADYTVIHNMLLLRDWQPYLLMGAAVCSAAPIIWILERRNWRTPYGGRLDRSPEPIQVRHLHGAVVFGVGWAISGACPGPALAMSLGGSVMGAVVLLGLVAGILLRERVAARQNERGEVGEERLVGPPGVREVRSV
ncbi:MAG TPA: DUF6691 family protein [Limnochordia bacterium]|nr:DUF6691 family protein [Limnochordia bacterium]